MSTNYNTQVPTDSVTQAVRKYDATRRAGERGETSTVGADHMAAVQESAISAAIDLSVDAGSTIYDGPAILLGIWVEVAVAVAAISIVDGATTRMTIPTGVGVGFIPIPGGIFETNLKVTPGATSTGTLRVFYRPLPAAVTWAY